MLVTVEDGRGRRDPRRTRSPDDRRHALHEGRALSRSARTRRTGCAIRCGASAPKGEGRFARISWDEALDEIAQRFKAIAQSPDGPQAILPYSYAGTMGLLQGSSMDRRFFHRLGASLLERTICSAAGKAGWASVVGASIGMDLEEYVNSKLILIWGSNPITSNLHFWTRAQEAKRRGAKLIAIDPYRSATAEKCHEHIAPFPGTDAALALGIMHVLIDQDFLDRDYVSRYTIGFDDLAARAREWTPERVARTCGIDADQVLRLARDYGTIRPAAIRLNYGMQRVAGGANAVRAVACLPALVGAWRDPAGGALLSSSGNYPTNSSVLERPDLIEGSPRTINMSTIGDALTRVTDPPIRAIYVYNSNPVAVAPTRRASSRDSRATTCSASCTRSFAPTRPTTRTSSCPPRHSSSRRTSTARTATCTCSRTILRSSRSPSRCRTPRCSAASRRAWGSPSPAFARATTNWRAPRIGCRTRGRWDSTGMR
jgi:anaerobic selenocysteine-containing dehydrogenase